MTEALTVAHVDQYENDHGGNGPCERCYWQARRDTNADPLQNLPIDVYFALPSATKLYRLPCKCWSGCAHEYLCDSCATTVEEPRYIEDLIDD